MEDNFSYRVTSTPGRVKQCSRLGVRFIASEASYCSAIYIQRYLPDTPPELQPAPELLFAPGRNRNGVDLVQANVEKLLVGDTQMNFFIAVSQNCNAYGSGWGSGEWQTYDVSGHVFNASNYDYIHYGLEAAALSAGRTEESIWAMWEQHPLDNQRWRIAWEDQRNTSWDNESSTAPHLSLQATKSLGYDGNGWPHTDAAGYRLLRKYTDRPDFNDQVIEVTLDDEPEDVCIGGGAAGGGEEDPDPDPEPQPPTWPEPVIEEEHISEWSEPDFTQPGCACPGNNVNRQNHKVLIRHRPPGNPTNVQMICVARPGADAHLRQHDDSVVCERR
jgi:hypothetical protein